MVLIVKFAQPYALPPMSPVKHVSVLLPEKIKAKVSGSFFFRRCSIIYVIAVMYTINTLHAQCSGSFSYANTAGWTLSGSEYTIGSNTFSFNATPGATYNYATHPLGCALSDYSWKGETDFTYADRGGVGVAHTLLSVTAGPLNSWNTNGTSYTSSNQDAIEAYIVCPAYGSQSTDSIFGRAKNGSIWNTLSRGIYLGMGATYYIRIERLSPSQGRISVFTNATRTVHAPGSPQYFPVGCDVTGLTTLQHGCIPQGSSSRTLTGTLANTTLTDAIPSLPALINLTSCHPITAPSGNAVYDSSGIYFDTIPSVTSCDSIIVLNVKILPSKSLIDTAVCVKYISPSGRFETDSSTVITDTIPNHLGCDSIITINVTAGLVSIDAGLPQSICSGDSIRLTAAGGAKYKWTPAATLDNDSIYNPWAKPVANTDYIVTVTSGLCSGKDTVRISVSSMAGTPDAGLPQSICRGDSIRLKASGGMKYKWTPAATLNNDSIYNPWAKPVANTNYIVTVSSGACSGKDTVRVRVSSLTPDAGLSQSICQGDSVRLNASGGFFYAWMDDGTLSDTAIHNPYCKPGVTTTYTVFVSDGICTRQDTVLIAVTGTGSISAGTDKSICEKDSVQLSVTGGVTYTWHPATGMSDTASATPKVSPAGTTQYIVVTSLANCKSSDTVLVTVNPPPVISAGNDTIICRDAAYQIPAVSSGADKYKWTPATFLDNDSLLQPVIKADSNIQYTIKAINSATNCFSYDTLNITLSIPVASFTTSTTMGTFPFNVYFTNTSVATNPTYSWYFEDVDSFYADKNPVHRYTQDGIFNVWLRVTDELGCIDSTPVSITAIDQLKIFIPSMFTPNGDGINDVFKIGYTKDALDIMTGSIWNRWGAKLYEFTMPDGEWWDGKEGGQLCQDDVYFYTVEALDHQKHRKNYSGTITLLR
jgi:gliding motility-associated-like protein